MALWGLTKNREAPEQRGPARKWLRRVLPYIGTLVIIIYLYFNLKDQFASDKFFNALRGANIPLLLIGTVIPYFIFMFFNILMASLVYTWFVTPLKARDIWSVRGATMLLNLINPALAGGAWVIYLMRKTGVTVTRALAMGGLGLTFGLTWLHVIVTTIWGLMLTGNYPPVSDKLVFWLTVYVLLGWLWFFQTVTFWLMGWKWGFINRIREWKIMELLRRADLRHWLIIGAMVLPSIVGGLGGLYICALAFGIKMPIHVFIGKFLRAIPYLFIPSVGQIGPLTAGWLEVYKGKASPEVITACTLAIVAMGHISRTLFGLVCIIPATREIATLEDSEPASDQSGLQDEAEGETPVETETILAANEP